MSEEAESALDAYFASVAEGEEITTEEVLLALADPAEAAKRQRIRALIEKKRKMMVVQDDILRLKTNLEKESWRFRRERSREAPDDV